MTMTKYTLLISRENDKENKNRKAYGIAVYRGGSLVRVVEDVAPDPDSAVRLIKLFNDEGLDPVHLDQAVEDYLTDLEI